MLRSIGFSVITTKYFGEYRSWENTWYTLLVLHLKKLKFYKFLKQKSFLQGLFYLNTFDHVYFAAQKRQV